MSKVIAFPTRRGSEDVELTKRQLADHWGVSTRWIELMVRDADLPSLGLFAGKRRFNLAEAEDWKRRRDGMSVIKRGNGWGARVYLGGGRWRWVGTFRTRRAAKEAEAEAIRNRVSKRTHETVDSFAERWTRDFPRSRETTNLHNAERIKPLVEAFKGIRLSDVDRVMAREWAQRNPRLARYARSLFEDARNDGLVEENPFSNLRLPGSKGRKDEAIPTEAELHTLADMAGAVHGPQYGPEMRAMILFSGYVGLRAGELYSLDWDHVDLQAGQVRIERSFASKNREYVPPKSGKPRTVYLPPQAKDALRGKPRRPEPVHVFSGKRGQRLTATTHFHLWNPVRAAARVGHIDWHSLRHVAGTLMAERGLSVRDIAWQLGQTDGGRIAHRLYIHTHQESAMERVAQAFRTSPRYAPSRTQMRRRALGLRMRRRPSHRLEPAGGASARRPPGRAGSLLCSVLRGSGAATAPGRGSLPPPAHVATTSVTKASLSPASSVTVSLTK